MADEDKERMAAAKGFRGYDRLIQHQRENEFGFTDKMTVDIPKEPMPEQQAAQVGTGSTSIRSRQQADLNERLMQQGVPPAEILRREQQGK